MDNNPNIKFIFYFLFFFIIIALLVLKSILEYRKAKTRVMKENISRIANNKNFIACIVDYIRKSPVVKEILNSGLYPSFDYFYDMVEEALINQFKNDYEKHIEYIPGTTLDNPLTHLCKYPYFPTLNSKLDVFEEALESIYIENELLRIFYNRFEEGVKEAEKIEKEAIEYHKTFGEEPSGDPKLHPKDNTESINKDDDIIEEVSLDKLIASGTIEDIEDNNLNNF